MTTFLVFSVTSRKEIQMEELEINDLAGEIEPWEMWDKIKTHITPPYNGKTFVVEKEHVRTFKLRSEVVEIK